MTLQLGVVTSLPEDLSWIYSIHTTHDYLQLQFQRLQGPFLGTLWAPGTQMLHIIYIQANAHTDKSTYILLNIVYFWEQFRLVHKRIEWRFREVPYITCLDRPSLTTGKSSTRRLHIIGYSWCLISILGSELIWFAGLFFLVCLPLYFQGRVSVGSHDCPETGSLV